VELHEDNPKAMMVLLRYLYGNSYPTTDCYDESSIGTSLQDHAQIFVVADKYQIPKLRDEALENMKGIGFNEETFVPALRMIFNATTPNSIARKLMTDACVDQLYDLRLQDAFMALLPELPELAVEIVRHPHLTYVPAGKWFCHGCEYSTAGCGVVPMSKCHCGLYDEFEKSFAWEHRYRDEWPCPRYSREIKPCCSVCELEISWEEPSS